MDVASDQPKISRYLRAGSPIRCFLPACQISGKKVLGNFDEIYDARPEDKGDEIKRAA